MINDINGGSNTNSILRNIKVIKHFDSLKNRTKTEYTDLAPVDEITNGDEYLNALDWALRNKRIKNIALAGPYGAGKSSIIETYLKQHPKVKEKSLRISMATFVENGVNENGTSNKIDIGQDEIELGILKQLFYKVDYRRIPQSRYRKLHKIGWQHIWACLIGLCTIITVLEYIFFTKIFNFFISEIIAAGSSIKMPFAASLLLFGVLLLCILAIIAIIYRSIASHFKIKEIKLPANATMKSEEDSNETIFDKNMDEIVYFFEETKYRLVFFEDLDRLDDSSIFVQLRELNMILNNYDNIKIPVVFVYAVKDDIFSDADRTKFFEFIIPVIPVINSTNSGEQLLDKLNASSNIGIHHDISQNFVMDVSPYISDMRILQNIYNEFVIYKKTLRIDQNLNLSDEPMMALIIYKNLYPRDFADIQMERGVIKQAFTDKKDYLKQKQTTIQSEIDELTKLLKQIQCEVLESMNELKSSLLCEITGWNGIAYQIFPNRASSVRASEIMNNDFDVSKWNNLEQCSGYYHEWNGNGGKNFVCSRLQEICISYLKREKAIKSIEENRIKEEQKKVEKLKMQLQDIFTWSLKKLIEQFGADEVLSSEVRKNKLLVFLLRKGYIDEKYANYINYFKGKSVTIDDMNFILSVKNMEPKSFDYNLTITSVVVQRLQAYEFGQKAIYNFDLLDYLLSSNEHNEKLNVFIKQLADEDVQSWKFVDEFIDLTMNQSRFVILLASAWPNMWRYVAKNGILTYERKIHYLSLLILDADITAITSMNANNEMSDFIKQNEDILQQLTSLESSKVIDVIKTLHIIFSKVSIENVSEEILDYLFENNCYELNETMIQHVVEYKNEALVPNLKSKNYTTIIKLGYAPMIKYLTENLSQYIKSIVLTKENVCESKENIIDLIERSIDCPSLCVQLIEHENFCLNNITSCCNDQIAEKKAAVKSIWDALLKGNKIIPTWENVSYYWSAFKFSQDLLNYIENHTKDLVGADSQCIDDDFIRELIGVKFDDGVLKTLLPCIQMDNFDICLGSVTENRVSIMIDCNYFGFTVTRYEEIKKSFPDLCIEFILQNQNEYITAIDKIEMDSDLLEELLFSRRLEAKTAQVLFDTYGAEYMTSRIAANLKALGLSINLTIFNAAWKCLDKSGKQNLMLEHMELLDADAMHACFVELEKWYSNFLDRSNRHVVELANTPENKALAARLQAVDYITSYSINEKKEYDSVAKAEIVSEVIRCRVKAIKSNE